MIYIIIVVNLKLFIFKSFCPFYLNRANVYFIVFLLFKCIHIILNIKYLYF